MVKKTPKRMQASPDSELVHTIKEAISDGVPLVVEANGESYSLHPEIDRAINAPKSKRMKAQLLALAGVWSDLDADALIERIYAARRAAPPSEPIKE
jgi:hypothetical protein